jgi:tetratricopeptide repeat protein 21B
VAVLNEAAYQQQVGGDYAAAIGSFSQAARIDERDGTMDDLRSMYGTIHCQLLAHQLDDAAKSLNFLSDIATEGNVKLAFLTALHASKVEGGDVETPLAELESMLVAHVAAVARRPFSYDYFVHLDPDLLVQSAELFLSRESGEPRENGEAMSPGVERAMALLEAVCRRAPGLMPAQLLLMRTRYVAGQHDAAGRTANAILRLDNACSDAQLILSQIHLSKGNHRSAQVTLDNAIANNFAVRESALYSIISAQCKVLDEDFEGGLKELEAAMKIPGIRTAMTPQQAEAARKKKALPISTRDRATVFLMYAQVLGRLERTAEADAAVKAAMAEFQGTAEEVRVMIANCDLALLRGDTNRALKMLIRVPPDSPHYARAKMALAKIHLEKRNDKAAYVKCYEDLAAQMGDAKSHVALGEAYMAIGEPDLAVKAYERATEQSPGDVGLTSKIGRALIITHDFARAVAYFEAARADDPAAAQMQMELAELYIRLRRYGDAEEVLLQLLDFLHDAGTSTSDPQALEQAVACTRMLAKVHAGVGDAQGHLDDLLRARALQSTLVTRSRGDPEALRTQQVALAGLCLTIAEEYRRAHSVESAAEFFDEALKHDEGNLPAMLALARLRLSTGDVDGCQQMCVGILREDDDNEEASLMLAELMFQKEHYETAIYHFQQLLEKNPRNYRALAQLVQLLRRSGRLEEVPGYMKRADRSSAAAAHDPGLCFCKGLAERYSNAAHEALAHLNRCRKDREWGPDAVYTMVEIYLSPENEQLWDEEGASMLSDGPSQVENTDHIRAAEKLLCEVRRRQDPRHRVLEAYVLIATKTKANIDSALGMLLEIVNDDHDSVPALLAMATCFMLLKQTPKARNQLKRVSKLPFNSAEADEFERSWLMLAEIHIQGGKYDLAQEMCKKCLKYNKSCAKAWELIGQVMEREQSYLDAAEHYERSWKFSSGSSPAVGFRLAFNYLKAKRFVEAIDVCQKVLKEHPAYPKIQKDILDKARMSIRP